MLRSGVSPRVVIFAWGNETRGDDGLGPRMAARIAASGWTHITLIEDFQLQVEHALDLVGQDFVLFIDAGRGTPGPYVFARTAPHRIMTHTSHGVGPESVLEAYRQVMNDDPPPSFVLCLRGENFDLEERLSPEALSNLADAWGFLIPLLSSPELEKWDTAQTGGAETIVPPTAQELRPAAE
ncbi:hydrogenase maturation protease [Rhodobacter aestuarii]|uniref:Hydrogenase maturation protease n=1 Tax=Rhodobacter aestuarii TaxID=453582 RepID=A0A1N7KZL8_9RHOB|nr:MULTISPECIES: hydrogenase maturation protease [Rhodobacter]PTV95480.1 hydrogenase maturation protease [Rhodobacter aestuarii]SIS67025.1 hydrogenase maturation protease [Rhodobacter aestuarii]SOB89923.1 hydrogenase maturation protease [Rhodobacter sp. JA431]